MSENTSEFYDIRGEKALSTLAQEKRQQVPTAFSAPYTYHELTLQPTNANGSFLDIGCGTGLHSFFPTEKGYAVTGIDISEKSIEAAQKLSHVLGLESSCSFQVLSSDNLHQLQQDYDVIFTSGVLYYLDRSTTLPKIKGRLKKDGQFICIETNGSNVLMNVVRRIKNLVKRNRDSKTINELIEINEFRSLQGHFEKFEIRFFDFLTLLTIPFSRWPSTQKMLHSILAPFDHFLLNVLPLSFLSFKVFVRGTGAKN